MPEPGRTTGPPSDAFGSVGSDSVLNPESPVTPLEQAPSVTDEVIATIPELPRDAEADSPVRPGISAGSWPDEAYRGWSGL